MKRIISIIIKQAMLCLVVAVVLLLIAPSMVSAQYDQYNQFNNPNKTRIGIAGTIGGGLFITADQDFYGGIGVDIYPELGIMIDYSMIRLGLKTGLIYRKHELYFEYSDSWGNYYSDYSEYTLAFLPIQGEVLIAPLSGQDITPFVGIMAGMFLAVGDNEENGIAISPKVGLEASFDPIIFYGDVRYTYAPITSEVYLGDYKNFQTPQYGSFDVDAGGLIFTLGIGIRLGM